MQIIWLIFLQARTLTAQVAETEKIRFLIGTQSLKQVNNQIHLVEFNEETSVLKTNVSIYLLYSSYFLIRDFFIRFFNIPTAKFGN